MSDRQSPIEDLKRGIEAARTPEARQKLLVAYAEKRDGRGTSDTYDYERGASDLAVAHPDLIPLAEGALRSGKGEPSFRFLCTSIAFNGLRREGHLTRAKLLLEDAEKEFGDVPLFLHYQAMASTGGSARELREGLDRARQAHVLLPDNAGVAHTCAVLIADLGCDGALENTEDELRQGIDLVTEAITRFSRRARFYHTRARLRRLQQDYEGARMDIAHAIDIEDREGSDASKRMATYLIERSMIEADQSISRLAKEAHESNDRLAAAAEKLQRSIESSQIRLIETVAFITAILGLVLATMGEIRNQSPLDALLVLAGVAVILFGAVILGSWLLSRQMKQ